MTELVGDNPPMHRRLLEKFLINAEQQAADITSAAAAMDIRTQASVAHTLKSAARSVGALALGELCQSIESFGHAGDAAACNTLAEGLPSALAEASTLIRQHLMR